MLRILDAPGAPVPTIRLEGKLLEPWVPEVRAAVARLRRSGPAGLDLQGLRFVDHSGLELLRELRADEVRFSGASPFIQELLAQPDRHPR